MDSTADAEPDPAPDAGRVDAFDQLIAQERDLIAYYEGRQSSADAVAAAAVTGVLGLAALTATLAKTNTHVDRAFAWVIVAAMVIVCLAALTVRSLAGLQHTDTARLSSGSPAFDQALAALRECGDANLDPIEVRRRILTLVQARAEDAHRAAKTRRGAPASPWRRSRCRSHSRASRCSPRDRCSHSRLVQRGAVGRSDCGNERRQDPPDHRYLVGARPGRGGRRGA